MTFRRRYFLAIGLVAVIVGVGWWSFVGRPKATPSAPAPAAGTPVKCEHTVTKVSLQTSVDLGTHFMVVHQKPAGNFDYEYDWKTKRESSEDNAARQSGALWGLSLLYEHAGAAKAPPELAAALKRGLAYFDDSSQTTHDGAWRYPVYRGDGSAPTEATGGIGMAALVTLAIIDYVRALPATEEAERTRWTARANEYIAFLAGMNGEDGLWPADYRYDTGVGVGAHSPYSDGEALLALVTAMKYLSHAEVRPVIERAAAAGHKVNVDEARAQKPDSETTKGYYQWSSMAYYELATSSMSSVAPYGDWLLGLADWILDVHKVLERPRNTGYAYEGLVSAYAWAKKINDPRAEKLRCAIHQGLWSLLGWQVGHPRAAALGTTDDPKALGGVQNHATEPALRIDVVQHQMHATMLAEDYLFD